MPQYSHSRSKLAINWKLQKEQRFDYVAMIGEESRPFQNLTKIYVQRKKSQVPPPTAYNMMRDWKKD